MNIDKAVMCFAGCVVLSSLALSHWAHPNWIWLTAFAGVNMIQASFSAFCPIVFLLRRIGLTEGSAFTSCKTKS